MDHIYPQPAGVMRMRLMRIVRVASPSRSVYVPQRSVYVPQLRVASRAALANGKCVTWPCLFQAQNGYEARIVHLLLSACSIAELLDFPNPSRIQSKSSPAGALAAQKSSWRAVSSRQAANLTSLHGTCAHVSTMWLQQAYIHGSGSPPSALQQSLQLGKAVTP